MVIPNILNAQYLNKLLAPKRFKLSVTNSLNWFWYSLELYKAAQVLFEVSKSANDQELELFVKEIETHRSKKNSQKSISRDLTIEEYKRQIDSSLIHFSYYFLARAIEVLLKALLIERDKNYFYKQDSQGRQIFDKKKMGHEIDFLIDECKIRCNEQEKKLLSLLKHKNIWGTYPVPLNDLMLLQFMNDQDGSKKQLNIKSYTQVSLFYDKILDTFNEARINNGNTTRTNVFR